MIDIVRYCLMLEMAKKVIALVDLTNIQIINNDLVLSDAAKRNAKIEYLNKQLDKYEGDNKQKLQCFCSNDLKMQPNDNLNTCKVGSSLKTQLEHAATCGDLAIIEWLLSKGVNINYRNETSTALHIIARMHSSTSAVEFLVQNNADVNKRTQACYYNNIYYVFSGFGSTALTEAVRYGNLETFKALLATTQVSEKSLIESYKCTKEILRLLQLDNQDYNKELHKYIESRNVKEGVKKILAYIENIENSVFILFGMKRGIEKSEFAVLPLDIFKNIASFLFPQDRFITYRIKVTEQKIKDKRLSTAFFSSIAKRLNSYAIDNAVFNKYIEDHGGNRRTAGALVLRR